MNLNGDYLNNKSVWEDFQIPLGKFCERMGVRPSLKSQESLLKEKYKDCLLSIAYGELPRSTGSDKIFIRLQKCLNKLVVVSDYVDTEGHVPVKKDIQHGMTVAQNESIIDQADEWFLEKLGTRDPKVFYDVRPINTTIILDYEYKGKLPGTEEEIAAKIVYLVNDFFLIPREDTYLLIFQSELRADYGHVEDGGVAWFDGRFTDLSWDEPYEKI